MPSCIFFLKSFSSLLLRTFSTASSRAFMIEGAPAMKFDGRLVARTVPASYRDVSRGLQQQMDSQVKVWEDTFGRSTLEGSWSTFPRKFPLHLEKIPHVLDLPQDGNIYKSPSAEEPNLTSLDIYLHDESSAENANSGITIHMNRHTDEPIQQALRRLLISLDKKGMIDKNYSEYAISIIHPDSGEIKRDVMDTTATNRDFWVQTMETPMILRIFDKSDDKIKTLTFLIEANPPTITSVQTFEDFRGYLFVDVPIPVQYSLLFANHCRIDWYVEGRGCVLEDSYVYRPSKEDLNRRLFILMTPVRPTHDGRHCQMVFSFAQKIQERPDSLLWKSRGSAWHQRCQETNHQNERFRVMTYNILADQNAFGSEGDVAPMYPHISEELLSRARRFPMVLWEILEYKADIICLQEVDEYVYERFLEPAMRFYKYDCFMTSKASYGTREGCAIFWYTGVFEAESHKSFVIRDIVSSLEMDHLSNWKSSNDALLELLRKHPEIVSLMKEKLGHIAQFVCLRSKANKNSRPIWVSNTHLFFHPDASHIRLIQSYLTAYQLAHEIEKSSQGLSPAVIMCGDLNSSLHKGAGKLLVDRTVPQNWQNLQLDLHRFRWEEGSSLDCGELPTALEHNFPSLEVGDSWPAMKSAFEWDGAPPVAFTHLVGERGCHFRSCLDHVLLSSSSLKPVSWAHMPSLDECPLMPSEKMFSDHVSLVCDVEVDNTSLH